MGIDPERLVDGFPFALGDLDDVSGFIPFDQAAKILARAAELTACPHIGLVLGSRAEIRALGRAGQAFTTAPVLRDSIMDFVALQSANSGGAVVYLLPYGDDFLLGYGAYLGGMGINRQVYDLALAVAFHAVKAFTAGAVTPLEVLVCQARPDVRQPYELFKAPVLFNQKQAGLVYSKAAMETRIVTANAQQHMRTVGRGGGARGPHHSGAQPFTARVRHSMRPLLLLKRATMDEIAAAMNSSVRVLRRRLAGEGTTFAKILDEVRYAMAIELLQMTQMPLAEIADALSFAHPGTFSRAFRRWSGISPARFRSNPQLLRH